MLQSQYSTSPQDWKGHIRKLQSLSSLIPSGVNGHVCKIPQTPDPYAMSRPDLHLSFTTCPDVNHIPLSPAPLPHPFPFFHTQVNLLPICAQMNDNSLILPSVLKGVPDAEIL